MDKKKQWGVLKTTILTEFPLAPIKLIGREKELRDLETLLSENKRVVLVHGVEGTGKTEVCRTFFRDYHGCFAYAAWVDYQFSLRESFCGAINADILGENPGDYIEERFQKIIHFLQSQPGQVFLVVDNIDNEGDPDLGVLTTLGCPVLLNSRYCLESFPFYSLDVLDINECKELFYRFYQSGKNDEMVAGLLEWCGRHTLTVELLARVGQQEGIKLKDLLRRLGKKGLSLDEPGEEAVPTSWNSEAGEKKLLERLGMILDLSRLRDEEIEILVNLSILQAIYIEERFIQIMLGLKRVVVMERLVKLGWLSRRGSQILMPTVIQEVVKKKHKPTAVKCRKMIIMLSKLLNAEPQENPLDKKAWLVCGEVVMDHLSEEDEYLAILANNISSVYHYMGDLNRALMFMEKAQKINLKILGKDHPELATNYNNLSMLYQDLGDLQKSLAFQEKVIEILEKTQGKDYNHLATSYNNISMIYKDLGDLERALAFQEKAHKIYVKILGKDHPELATSYNNLSLIYMDLGELGKAQAFQEQAIGIMEKSLGKDHPNLATSYGCLSTIYKALGMLDKALAFQEKSIKIYKKILGQDHPLLANSYHNQSSIYKDLGDLDRALSFQEQALAIFEKTLGKDHPNMAASYNNLSLIYHDLGDLDRALSFQVQALAIYEKTLGKDHPSLATSYNNLSMIYHDLGDLDRALSFQEQAHGIYEKTLGKDHPDLGTSYNNLSRIYKDLGDMDRALEYQLKDVEISEKTLGKDHPDLACSYHNLSAIYENLKDYQQALFFSRQAVTILQTLFPNGHPKVDLYKRNLEEIEKKAAAAGETAG